MALGIEKYKDALIAAWKDVLDDKTNTNWALFSYEGQTNDLKVVGKGDGGIEEMREDLNSGKIMYAFCKVLDPKTSLNKFVLVNWQGEGAPHPRKATSANHIRDVTNLLKGTHVTINARNEEEVDNDIVIEKLSKATASAYSFKDRGETVKDSAPVGTTYKRVIPQQEINSNERDKFWQKEEEEEKKRQEAERKRREEEKRKLENEIKQREIEEAVQREAKIKERSKSISVLREVERNELMRVQAANIVEKEDTLEDREQEEIERRGRSEILKRERSQEAQALISKRTINARAVFEQNTSAGQMIQRRASYQPSSNSSVVSPVKEKVRWPPTDHPEPEPSSPPQPEPPSVLNTEKQPETTEDIVTSQQNVLVEQKNGVIQDSNGTLNGNEVLSSHTADALERAQPYLDDAYLNNGASLEDYEDEGLRAQALYDYQAADETEISFDPGDIITRIDQIDAGWWQGMAPDGSYGLFPANYVQLLD
ncbi:drebrin-like protein isoform X1 [Macrosteles quadrilineatus]|uniref:drebrin-like protein isoform X1 n=1 Tax=Macrosteles quadrilineatus TaxID=74068 RepID=UPI0023E0C502|nr:drebrin-like protein isoform X1 [Macrosteles quadrilineatus]